MHREMKIIALLSILLMTFMSSDLKAQKDLKVSFVVTDWAGNPIDRASIYIITEPERRKKGKHERSLSVTKNEKKNISSGTIKLPGNLFSERIVTIRVFDGDPFSYHKIYEESGLRLSHKQVVQVQLERDWERYNSRTRKLIVQSSIYNMDESYTNSKAVEAVFSNSYEIEIPGDDFDNSNEFNTNVVFRIDSTCTIVDRSVESAIEPWAENMVMLFLDKVQSKLKQKLNSCEESESMTVPFYYKL